MAAYRKRGSGWRVEVCKHGIRDTATFKTKAQATAWAVLREADILSGKASVATECSLREVLERYAAQVTPQKRNTLWEARHIERLVRDLPFIDKPIAQVSAEMLAAWRDMRLNQVAPASVARELALLSAIFTRARREWNLLLSNPISEIVKPPSHNPRDRRISAEEEQALLAALGYVEGSPPRTNSQQVAYLFLLALETAMRRGELLAMKWEQVNLARQFIHLPITKNGLSRNVPLSKRAVQLLSVLRTGTKDAMQQSVFQIPTASTADRFSRAIKCCGIADLHFHDTRHEAITRLARKLDVLDLARMTGHKDTRSLMVYYNATASEVAARLG